MASVYTRVFDITFQNGNTTPALIVSNGSTMAKPKAIVDFQGALWRYRKQLVDKNTGELLPEYMYVQDNSVQEIKTPTTFFAEA